MKLNIVHSTELDGWIKEHHYLHTTPAGAVLRMEFLDDAGCRIGAMMWGRNPSPKTDQNNQLCLTRMYFVDDTERFVESKALAMARKYIRKHLPHIKGLVAYSSSGAGHEGVVYLADNWFSVSSTMNGKRDYRANRKNVDTSVKVKWVRSP
ncbi:MAG: hypothetical protein J6D17_14800 [Bacteroides sp.]|nr:hypothetical protein [Bacteroides sp.]